MEEDGRSYLVFFFNTPEGLDSYSSTSRLGVGGEVGGEEEVAAGGVGECVLCVSCTIFIYQLLSNGRVRDFFRYYAGQKEYEVELQFSSGLTGHPDRLKMGWEDNRDGEDPVPGSSSDLGSELGMSQG